MTRKVHIKTLNPNAVLPTYATSGSAGADIHACLEEPLIIQPDETILIPTGFAMYLADTSICATLLPRSGLGHKHGIVLGNLTGLIDSDYQGQVFISCWNRSNKPYTIEPADRIAQMVIVPIELADFEVVDNFEGVTFRAEGGFNSTGK